MYFVMSNVLCNERGDNEAGFSNGQFYHKNVKYCLIDAISQLEMLSTTSQGLKTYSGVKIFTANAP